MIRLCSGSETRANLLKDFGVAFEQAGCDFDEERLPHITPKQFVYDAAQGKFTCCKRKYGLELPLLAADTVVTAGGHLLRKAKDEEDARHILQLQSGGEIAIITATLLQSKALFLSDISATYYRFDTFDPQDVERYLQSGLWRGKAGACMVEGFCKKYIRSVRGLQSNAMGLPVEKLIPFIKQ